MVQHARELRCLWPSAINTSSNIGFVRPTLLTSFVGIGLIYSPFQTSIRLRLIPVFHYAPRTVHFGPPIIQATRLRLVAFILVGPRGLSEGSGSRSTSWNESRWRAGAKASSRPEERWPREDKDWGFEKGFGSPERVFCRHFAGDPNRPSFWPLHWTFLRKPARRCPFGASTKRKVITGFTGFWAS